MEHMRQTTFQYGIVTVKALHNFVLLNRIQCSNAMKDCGILHWLKICALKAEIVCSCQHVLPLALQFFGYIFFGRFQSEFFFLRLFIHSLKLNAFIQHNNIHTHSCLN